MTIYRLLRRPAVLALGLATLGILLQGAAHADTPLITAWIGTATSTSHVGYFVLDFNDAGANPQTYAFGWNYEGQKTDADFIEALATSLTGPNGFTESGAASDFVTELGYNGISKFNDFAGNNSPGQPNGFWNLWLGSDGSTWTSSQFGANEVSLSDTPQYTFDSFAGQDELSGDQWQGWRWVNDFTTDTPQPPRTPQVPLVTPEPGTLALLIPGAGLLGIALVRRRKK